MSLIRPLSKLFKILLPLCLFLFSCEKRQDKQIAIKAGDKSWTFQEVQSYFQLRLNESFITNDKDLEKLKQELIREIFLSVLIENWAKKNNISLPKPSLSSKERARFSQTKRQALKKHRNYLSLHNLLIKTLSDQIPKPSIKKQKVFYKKNQALFIEPPTCHLKQILVRTEKMAQALQQRLKQGEPFDKLSKLYSLNKENPGWIKKGELEVFDRVCWKENIKGLSPVIKNPYGYSLFLVGDKRSSKKKSFKQAQGQIIPFLQTQSLKSHFQQWLKKETSQTPFWTDKKLLEKIQIQYKSKAI